MVQFEYNICIGSVPSSLNNLFFSIFSASLRLLLLAYTSNRLHTPHTYATGCQPVHSRSHTRTLAGPTSRTQAGSGEPEACH